MSHSLWHPKLYEFTFNLSSGEMTRTALAPGLSSDMPAIDRSLTGMPQSCPCRMLISLLNLPLPRFTVLLTSA